MRVTCRGTYAPGASVPITVQLFAQQGTCVGSSANATATATVACCVTTGSTTGASSVAAPADAAMPSSCWQHRSVNNTCTASTQPAAGSLTWSYLNRGALAGGMLRAGILSGCSTTNALDVGVASTTCTSTRAITFNVTVHAGSSVAFHFWVGCLAPANATASTTGRCFTWKQVPSPSSPVSALQPAVKVNNGYASYTWINTLVPGLTCNCNNLFWAVSARGTFKTSASQCV